MTIGTLDDVASRLVLHLLTPSDGSGDLATAYERAIGWDLPHPSVGVPLFEAAVGLLVGNGIAVATDRTIGATSRLNDLIETIVLETGGWLRWFTEVEFGSWAEDADAPNAPDDVHGGSLEAAIIARCTEPAVPWTMPTHVKIARRGFWESAATPLGVALVGLAGLILGPLAMIGGVLWSPVAAGTHVVQRIRRKR